MKHFLPNSIVIAIVDKTKKKEVIGSLGFNKSQERASLQRSASIFL